MVMVMYLARAVLKVIWSKEQESKERQEKELQPVFQAQQVPGDKDDDEGVYGDDQVPLQAGKHLEDLSKCQGAGDHNKHCPESLGAEHKWEEAEQEEEKLHERGED